MNIGECAVGFVVVVVFGFLITWKTIPFLYSNITCSIIYGSYSTITQKYKQKKINMKEMSKSEGQFYL